MRRRYPLPRSAPPAPSDTTSAAPIRRPGTRPPDNPASSAPGRIATDGHSHAGGTPGPRASAPASALSMRLEAPRRFSIRVLTIRILVSCRETTSRGERTLGLMRFLTSNFQSCRNWNSWSSRWRSNVRRTAVQRGMRGNFPPQLFPDDFMRAVVNPGGLEADKGRGLISFLPIILLVTGNHDAVSSQTWPFGPAAPAGCRLRASSSARAVSSGG